MTENKIYLEFKNYELQGSWLILGEFFFCPMKHLSLKLGNYKKKIFQLSSWPAQTVSRGL